ncbi:MAG: tRNA (guanosine(37)-N1)-methyltransferase TrmD [bacterium]
MKIDIITIFPRMLDGFLGESMMKRAVANGHVEFNSVDLRDFTTDRHRTTDDRPFGGGPGMLMKPEPLFKAIVSCKTDQSRVILMSPQGRPFTQTIARELTGHPHLVLVCGHYEGVDERVREALVDEEISIGDYVLTNGVLAAAVVCDAVVRLIPGVLGGEGAAEQESFSAGLLEFPQYTRPADYQGMKVPDVLVSGNHEQIAAWRREQSKARTKARRPDLLG